jgi:hypothetical protein
LTLPFVPCARTAEVTLRYSQYDGSEAINTLWFQGTATYTPTTLATLADAIASWWNDGTGIGDDAGLKAVTASGTSLQDVTARDMSTQAGPVVVWNTGLPIDGTNSNDPLELGLTVATTFRTGIAGRAYRGRNFMAGMCVDGLSLPAGNIVSDTLLAKLVTAYGGLLTYVPTVATNGDHHVVASRYHVVGGSLVSRDAGILTHVISYGHADNLLDFQRRRAPGHNRHR